MDIVDRIKELCQQKDITITELERNAGIGRSTIRNWSTSSPNTDKLQKVADYFHVSVDYLLGRDETKKAQVVAFQRAADGGMSEDELDDILSYAKFRYPERFK